MAANNEGFSATSRSASRREPRYPLHLYGTRLRILKFFHCLYSLDTRVAPPAHHNPRRDGHCDWSPELFLARHHEWEATRNIGRRCQFRKVSNVLSFIPQPRVATNTLEARTNSPDFIVLSSNEWDPCTSRGGALISSDRGKGEYLGFCMPIPACTTSQINSSKLTQRTNIMKKNGTNYHRHNRIKANINPWVRMLVLGFKKYIFRRVSSQN
jgi:hypothetical protein